MKITIPLVRQKLCGMISFLMIMKTALKSIFVCLVYGIVSHCVAKELPVLSFSVTTLPEYNQFIYHEKGWTGADGSYSVALSDTVTLWLYGDTWIGEIVNHVHTNSDMINNSIAIQQGKEPKTASIHFYWQTAPDGKPASFITPKDGNGWFWPNDGIMANHKLYLFASQMVRAQEKSDSIFNFKGVGTWLVEIDNPQDNPLQWHIQQHKVYVSDSTLSLGTALLQSGNYIYIYGYRHYPNQWDGNNMVVARVPPEHLTEFKQWRYFSNGKWVQYSNRASNLFKGLAPEYSVSYLPALKKYITIYTENGMSKNIQMRNSPTPFGPWSTATTIYACPDFSMNSTYFCYAAKAHPSISTAPNQLVITYVCNSFDFGQLVKDSRIYFPRFLRLTFH